MRRRIWQHPSSSLRPAHPRASILQVPPPLRLPRATCCLRFPIARGAQMHTAGADQVRPPKHRHHVKRNAGWLTFHSMQARIDATAGGNSREERQTRRAVRGVACGYLSKEAICLPYFNSFAYLKFGFIRSTSISCRASRIHADIRRLTKKALFCRISHDFMSSCAIYLAQQKAVLTFH
jgi:hypothetical protein